MATLNTDLITPEQAQAGVLHSADLAEQKTVAEVVASVNKADANELGLAALEPRVTANEDFNTAQDVINTNVEGRLSSVESSQDVAGFDVIVLAGQSNMIGRYGPVDAILDATSTRIFQYGFDSQLLSVASDSLDHRNENPDNVGMGITFAKLLLSSINANRNVLLVPVAEGGTSINSGFWRVGGSGHEDAISRVNAAMQQGDGTNRLKAILWHQGETDSSDGVTQESHLADLLLIIDSFRTRMTGATSSTPFVCGGILESRFPLTTDPVQLALADVPNNAEYTGYASSTGLTDGGDNLHFSASSIRSFANRYYVAYSESIENIGAIPDAIDDLIAAPANEQVNLSWSKPSSNGFPVTDYIVQYKQFSDTDWVVFNDGVSTSTSASVTGLTNGVDYEFRVISVNQIGESLPSNIVTTEVGAVTIEPLAIRHYMFGTDNTDMQDQITTNQLAPVNTTPTHSNGYLTLETERKNGCESDFGISENEFTMCVVFRLTGVNTGFVCGNLKLETENGGASMIHTSGPTLAMNVRGGGSETMGAITSGEWYFAAISISEGQSRVNYLGDAESPTIINTSDSTINENVGVNLGIGNVDYDSSSFTQGNDIAEFVIFDSALSESQINGVYLRAVSRMADRGLTVN